MAPNSDVPRLLARLTRLSSGDHRVVSCYLKLEPRDRARGKYLIKIKNRVKAAQKALDVLGLDRGIRDAVERDLVRVQDLLKSPAHLPATQGLAIFACESLKLFEVVTLPRVFRSRLAVERTPLVRELASVDEEFGRLLTVVIDRTAARVFEVTAFAAEEVASLRADTTRGGRYHSDRQGAPGRGEADHHNRIREEKQRHFEVTARTLFELNRKHPAFGVVIAGPGPDAGALEPFLHPYLVERLMGMAHLNPKEVTPALVHTASLAVREAFERSAERSVVHQLEEGLGAGWSVNGAAETLRALARGQVRTLLVDADASETGFRCAASGALVIADRDCRGQGEPEPVLDIVDEAIEEALRQRVSVEVLHDDEARKAVDGLAALLRFR
jgi:peptide chain release factor subunit 1